MSYIPRPNIYSIEKGDAGTQVWAVQRALNLTGFRPRLDEDGLFGKVTATRVKEFQVATNQAAVDGQFGPKSSKEMAQLIQHQVNVELPLHLLEGSIESESGNYIAAVNTSVPGGADCGYTQRRVLASDYNNKSVVYRAFDANYQIGLYASTTRGRYDTWHGKPAVTNDEYAWRLAVLHHNYPYAAEKLALGLWPSSYSQSPQDWVINHNVKFPDGHQIRTPMEWCQRYSLGNKGHNEPGQMVKYVTNWSAAG